MKKNRHQLTERSKKLLYTSIGVVFIFVVWEILALSINNDFIFPNIVTLFTRFGELFINGEVWLGFLESFGRTLGALGISLVLAFGLGLLGGLFSRFRYFFRPIIEVLKLVPTPCVIFLIFLYLGKTPNLGSIIITSLVVFPILYESFVTGLLNIDDSIKMSLRLEGYYSAKSIFKVQLSEAFPYLMLGVLNTLGLGIKVSIVSEILLGTNKIWGIGRIIYLYKFDADFPGMFSLIILIVLMFLILDLLIFLGKKSLKKWLR